MDGMLDLADVIFAMQTMAAIPAVVEESAVCSDVNGNGKIDLAEAVYLLAYIAGVRP